MKIFQRLHSLLFKSKQSFGASTKAPTPQAKNAPSPPKEIQYGGKEPGWLKVLPADDLIELLRCKKALAQMASQSRLADSVFKRDMLPALHRYAEFVQLMPASESHHHAHAGGLLSHTLEMVLAAMTMRNGHLFPQYAPAEEIDAQRDQWTYVVFYAALLHDIAKPMTDLRILWRGGHMDEPIRWKPIAGPLLDVGNGRSGVEYRVEFEPKSARDYQAHSRLAITLLGKIAPPTALTFLAQTPSAFDALTQYLSGNRVGLLAEVVTRADMLSTAHALKAGSRARFATSNSTPLVELLMTAIKTMLQGTELPLNRSGAAGWVKDGSIWFVAKRLADQSRLWIKKNAPSESVPGDSKNDRLFDTWQEYGLIELNPSSGKAIWSCTVVGNNPSSDGEQDAESIQYIHELSLIRFPLHRIYDDPNLFPPEFDGKIIVNAKRGGNAVQSDAGSDDSTAESESTFEASELEQDEAADAVEDEAAAIEPSNKKAVPSSSSNHKTGADSSGKSSKTALQRAENASDAVISEPKNARSRMKGDLLNSIDEAEKAHKPVAAHKASPLPAETTQKEKAFPPLDDDIDYSTSPAGDPDDIFLDEDDEIASLSKKSKEKAKSNNLPAGNGSVSKPVLVPEKASSKPTIPTPKNKLGNEPTPKQFFSKQDKAAGSTAKSATATAMPPRQDQAAAKPHGNSGDERIKTGSHTKDSPTSKPAESGKASAKKNAPDKQNPKQVTAPLKDAVGQQSESKKAQEGIKTGSSTAPKLREGAAASKSDSEAQPRGDATEKGSEALGRIKTGSHTEIARSDTPQSSKAMSPKQGASRKLFGTQSVPGTKPVLLDPELPNTGAAEDVHEPSETASDFISWVQRGLADRSIKFNETGAEVHFVEEGMALVSPIIFQRYCKENHPDGGDKEWMRVQREIIKSGLHHMAPSTTGSSRVNILRYVVTGKGRVVAELSAVVLAKPDRYVLPVPEVNPVISLKSKATTNE